MVVGLLFLGLWELPALYYTIVHIIVSLCAFFFAILLHEKYGQPTPWMLTFLLIVLVYNPVLPLMLVHPVWMVVYGATAVLFISSPRLM